MLRKVHTTSASIRQMRSRDAPGGSALTALPNNTRSAGAPCFYLSCFGGGGREFPPTQDKPMCPFPEQKCHLPWVLLQPRPCHRRHPAPQSPQSQGNSFLLVPRITLSAPNPPGRTASSLLLVLQNAQANPAVLVVILRDADAFLSAESAGQKH